MQIVKVTNPFEPHSKELTEVCYVPKKPLAYYIDIYRDAPVVVSIEGEILPPEKWDTYLVKPETSIIIKPRMGKSALRLILTLAVAVVGALVSGGILLAALSPMWAAIVGASIGIAGSLIINAILPPTSPAKDQKDTPTYSWGGAQMTAQQGRPIGKGYGKFREAGNVIASFVETIGSKQYSNLLIQFGWGRAASISSIKINDNPITDYKGVVVDKRLGYLDQTIVSFFNALVNDYAQEAKLVVGNAVTVSGKGSDTEGLIVEVQARNGLYRSDDKDGHLTPLTVYYKVEYSKNSGAFQTALFPRTTADVSPTDYWVAIAGDQFAGGPNVVHVHATSPNPGDHFDGEPFVGIQTVNIFDDTGAPAGTQSLTVHGTWTLNPANPSLGSLGNQQGASVQTVTGWSTITHQFAGTTTHPIFDSVRISNLPAGKYDVRVTKLGFTSDPSKQGQTYPEHTTELVHPRITHDLWLSSIKEYQNDALTYPRSVLLAVRALATEQLSGVGLNVTALIDHGTPETIGYKNLVADDRPQIFYRFNDLTTASCIDSSGRANAGTFHGGVTVQKPTLITKSPAKAADFDGTGYVTSPSMALGTDYTVECILKPTALGFEVFTDGAGGGFFVDATGHLNLNFGGVDHLSAAQLVIGTTYHVALRVTAGTAMFTINGVKDVNTFSSVTAVTFSRVLFGLTGRAQAFACYNPSIRAGRLKQRYQWMVAKTNLLEDMTGQNPACVAMDILCNRLYGAATSFSLIDEVRFKSLADRSNETVSDGKGGTIYRHTFNGVFDTQMSVWEAVVKVGNMCAAVFVRTGTKYSVLTDAPATVTQVFGMGNIIKGSFKEDWLGQTDRANSVDLIFQDEANDYKRSPLTVEREEDIAAGADQSKSGSIETFGITNESEAWRLGMYFLLGNLFNLRTIEFTAWVDAVNCFPGDVVGFSHDVPRWGSSGRVKDSDGTLVNLDQKVTMVLGGSYTLCVRLDSVSRATGTISAIDGTVITLAGFTTDPTVKRLVTDTVDAKVVGWGTGVLEVADATGLNVGDAYTAYDTNVLENRDIVAVDGDTDTVQLVSPFSVTPKKYEVFVFGTGTGYKKFRVLDIQRRSDLTFQIRAIEYNPDIYQDLEPVMRTNASGYPYYGPLRPTTGTNDISAGTRAWINPGNVLASDDVYSTVANSIDGVTEDSNELMMLGPQANSVPTDVVNGVEVQIEYDQFLDVNGTIIDKTVKLVVDGIVVGSNKADVTPWAGPGFRTYGGPSDLWGTTLTPAQINSSSFGVLLQVTVHTDAGKAVTVAKVDSAKFIFYVSKASAAQVSNLKVTESNLLISGNYQNKVSLTWTRGSATNGADVFVSVDGQPEVLFERVTGASSYSFIAGANKTYTGRVVGFDAKGRSAPYNSAPTFSISTLGIPTNLLVNSSFQQSLFKWDVSWRASDNVSRSTAEDGYSQYNVVGSTLAVSQQFLDQTIDATKWAVGDYLMLSAYVWASGGTGKFYAKLYFVGPNTSSRAEYTLGTDTQGWVRINTATVQVPIGTTEVHVLVGFDTTPSIPVGTTLRVGHVLLEDSTSTQVAPSTWGDKDDHGNLFDVFQGGSSPLSAQASTPTISGQLSYTNSPTSITISWSSLQIKWPSGALTKIQDGSITDTGLANSTTYYAYPYFDVIEDGAVRFPVGNAGTASPKWLFSAKSEAGAQEQQADGHINLSSGSMSVATLAGGGGTGGGFGGGSGCPRARKQVVRHREKGIISCLDVRPGDEIYAGFGEWVRIRRVRFEYADEWIRITMPNGKYLEQSPSTPVPLPDGSLKRSDELTIKDLILGEGCFYPISHIEYVPERDIKAIIEVESLAHTYMSGNEDAEFQTHNVMVALK